MKCRRGICLRQRDPGGVDAALKPPTLLPWSQRTVLLPSSSGFARRVGGGEQHAEPLFGERIADEEAGARIYVFREVVVRALERAPPIVNAVVVERPRCARSMVAPSEPSSTSADEVLRAVMLLNSSEANTLKSN